MLKRVTYYLKIVSVILFVVFICLILEVVFNCGVVGISFLFICTLFILINIFTVLSRKRIYKEISLNGNKEESQKAFQYIDNFVNKVIQTEDTINGLKVHFEKNATYNEFIEVLNIFSERGAQLYILDNNTMFFVGRDLPSEDIIDIDCEGPPVEYLSEERIAKINKAFEANNKDLASQQIFDNLKTQFLQNKIIYSAYFIFVFVALTYLIKRKST